MSLCSVSVCCAQKLAVPDRPLVERFVQAVVSASEDHRELAGVASRFESIFSDLGDLVAFQEAVTRLSRQMREFQQEIQSVHRRLDAICDTIQSTRGLYAAGNAELRALILSRTVLDGRGSSRRV